MKERNLKSGNSGVSRRGYYYNLSLSPFSYMGFKFPSAKKLDIFVKELAKRTNRLDNIIDYFELIGVDDDTIDKIIVERSSIATKLYNEMQQKF